MTAGDWRYVRASVPGIAHLASGAECQDACAARLLAGTAGADAVLALAVADGAGSAAESRTGAELACQTLLDELEAWLNDQDSAAGQWTRATAEMLLARVRAALEQRAVDAGRPVREFACTLLGAVVAADRALLLQIGDGAIVIGAGDGYQPVFWPQGGEYANETHFVTDPNAVACLDCAVLTEPVAEIALLTDGLQLLALHYQSRQAHAPFFRPLFQRLRDYPETGCLEELTAALERFLTSPAINQRTHDDKTLILASRLAIGNIEPATGADAAPAAVPSAEPQECRDDAGAASPQPIPPTPAIREEPGDQAV